ncbi:MAG: metallophosphoesterase [Prosthecobacter sp.]|nr:metallophosphoesterase [Prosthecobacter sp.]
MSLRPIFFLLLATTLCRAQEAPKAVAVVPVALQPASVQMVPGAPVAETGAFSIVVLPDTQFYAQLYPDIFHKQTQWIADTVSKYNTRLVIQVGDVTQTAVDAEWRVARDAFKKLEGKVPYACAPGNHDYGGRLQILSRRSPFGAWLPLASFQKMSTFGGVYDKEPEESDNQWHQFEAGGHQWLVIGVEFAPRADVLRWTNDVIGAHPGHSVIIFTHAYLDPKTNQRIHLSSSIQPRKGEIPSVPEENPDITHGEDLWQRVASKHPNVVMVLSGHASYSNHRTSPGASGQAVQEMVVDYQKDINGGNGWLRLLQVLLDGKTVRCQDYSPWIDQKCTMPDRTFDFEFATPAAK